ncbi:minor capsid protein [Dyadobacter sp. CY323]|uniref:minor capsid protein n=1 Tax=Dyadobacter sp. CY323 TaxID=2907302 RepID=UPI001F28B36F|nr:minor capsid protein [Dyadobacter sp. CY323]MCE6993062.1 phage head morphogenesis protein [Dyadobacter sp. CY323]
MSTINERILDAQIKHSVYLERYKSGVLKKIIGQLNRTEADLIEQIAARLVKIEQRGYDLGVDTTKRLNDMLANIQERRAKVYTAFANQLFNEMVDFATYEADFQIRLAENAGIEIDLSMPSNAQLKAVVQAQPFQGRLLREWGRSLERAELQRIQDAIRIGITEGQTTDQIVRRIRGTKAAKYQDGILEIARRDAEAVVRTAVAHTQNRARMEVFNANSDIIPGVQYAAVLDSRTTEICASRDGKVYRLDNAPPIPAHFRCRSIYVPYFGTPQGNRASQFGPVPASTNYAEWLKSQPVEIQEEVLGVAKAKLFRSGKLTLEKFVDKSGHVYTLKELARREKL